MASAVSVEDKYASLHSLLSQVHLALDEERDALAEWTRLEHENLDLRLEMQAHIHAKNHYLRSNSLPSVGGDTSGGGGSSSFRSFGEQELLLLRTASFLASSSALLRTQMQGVWTERRAMTTALAAAGDEFGAGFGAGGGAGGVSATAGKAALPAVSKDQQSEDLTPTPLPLPVISHQPPYCTLEFPLERISAEWRTVFPPEVLAAGTSGGGGTTDASERDRLEFEAILEDVWDSIQSNRALYEEYSAAAPKGAGGATSGPAALPPTGTTSPSGGQAAAAWRAESGESVMSHAMENFGFLLNPAIRAAMMGQHSSVTAAAAAANSTATVTAAGATSTATKTGTPATGLGLAAAAAANTTLSATAGATGGYMPYEFDEADSPSNIIMESDQASGAQDGPSGGGGAGAAAAAAATAAASAAAAAAAAAAAGSPSSASGAAASRNIKCATLNKLIERVTHEKYVDLNTRYVFLLTYHSFTTPRELLSKLSSRFHVPLPPNLSPEELLHFKTFKLDRIQIRVCSVLKNWLDEHWTADFAGDPTLKRELQTLINSMLENSGSLLTSQLAKALNALLKKKERMSSGPGGNTGSIVVQSSAVGAALVAAGAAGSGRPASSLSPGASSSAASSASPSSGVSVPPKLLISSRLTLDSFNLMDVDETELARQLTLIDFDKFKSIQPRECLNQNWSRALAIKSVLAPNILAMISQFNKVSLWVEIQILKQKELKMRAKYFEKFIKIAEQCRSLNNFNSLFAIYCGLSSNPIHRLKRTKAAISSKNSSRFSEFAELFKGDKNSRNFRRTLQQSLTPCIPHLGIFLSDLTFTEDGNPDLLLGNMINFQKRCKLAERIRWIKQYQQEGYNLQPAPVIQAYFQRELREDIDAEMLWKMSKEVEPREPGD